MVDLQLGRPAKLAIGVAAVGAAFAAGGCFRRWQWRRRREAGRRPMKDGVDILRQGFSMRKLPDDIDHVIVGSGLSGLYLAALLSRIGRRVVVLEQHYIAGGCTHTFKDKGFEFDTGVHYLGQATQLAAIMDFGAGRDGAFRLQRQVLEDGSQVFNELHLGRGFVHRTRPGRKTYANDIVAQFPDEEKAIRRYFAECERAGLGMAVLFLRHFLPQRVFRALLSLPGPFRWAANRFVSRTLDQVLTECGIKSRDLRALLSAEFGDYGTVPDRAPFFIHALIHAHYWEEGGFFPVGGSDTFALALVPAILDAGGAVLVRAPVSSLVVERGRVVGVEVGDKGVVRAKRSVISSAGAEVTYRRLLDPIVVEKLGGVPLSLERAEEYGSSHHLYAFFGVDGSQEDLKLPSYNILSFPYGDGENLSQAWRRSVFGASPGERPAFLTSEAAFKEAQIPVYLSCPSAKDPEYSKRCPGKSSIVMITECRAEYFGDAGPANKRGEEYVEVKRKYQELLLRALYGNFPQLEGKVTYIDVGTPWSNEHYLGRKSSYGLDHDASRFLDPSVRVQVMPGLYLTGQDVLADGIFTQPLAALLTASKVLGFGSFDFALLGFDFARFVLRRVLFDRTYAPALP